MTDIAIFHPYLDTRGGGEAVCMRTLEALEDEHKLTVYSLNDPDFDALNEYFNTTVTNVEHQSLGYRGKVLCRGGDLIQQLAHQPTRRLQAALSYSYVDQQNHDLIISTYNEFGFESPAVQYIDFPNFGPRFGTEPESTIERIYGTICNVAHRGTRKQIQNSTLLTNSKWSANNIKEVYGTQPQVVYPPVDTSAFDPQPWKDRENGFISIGRADPAKRPLKVMEIIKRLTERGHDIHLHWIGAVNNDAYGQKVRQRAEEIEAVTLEGTVSFDVLADLVTTHKYGLHGRVNEHFGMAVAELLSGGTIPFVHDSGGQREIVGQSEHVLYSDVQDAVFKIEAVLKNSDSRDIRDSLPDPEAVFGLERFRNEIRAVISQAVEDT